MLDYIQLCTMGLLDLGVLGLDDLVISLELLLGQLGLLDLMGLLDLGMLDFDLDLHRAHRCLHVRHACHIAR